MNIKLDIDNLVIKVDFLCKEIKDLDKLVDNFHNSEIANPYLERIIIIINEYNNVCNELSEKLKIYFEYEKENNIPKNINYLRLYKAINN